MNVLVVLNDPPYGTERSYNGLRLAGVLSKRGETEVRVFLLGDAVGCAMADQTTPNGYYNLGRMIRAAANHGAEVGCCGSCMEARGISDAMLVDASRRSSMDELADWTLWADNALVF